MSAASIAAEVERVGGHCIKFICMASSQKKASSEDDAQESPQTVC